MSEPIVAAALFRTVMAAAGGRCQCEGTCGQPHTKSAGRCPHEHDRLVRLMAAPVDPLVSAVAAAALSASELRAWCTDCHTAARRLAQKQQPAAAAGQCGLFDL